MSDVVRNPSVAAESAPYPPRRLRNVRRLPQSLEQAEDEVTPCFTCLAIITTGGLRPFIKCQPLTNTLGIVPPQLYLTNKIKEWSSYKCGSLFFVLKKSLDTKTL